MEQPEARLSRRFLLMVLGWLLLMRLAFDIMVAPLPDEAYYWLWGQRPDLGYFDHAPLQAWLLGLSSFVFGQNLFALRAPTWLTTAITLAVVWHNAHRFGGDGLASVTLFVATPILFIFTTMVFHDHLLIALLLLSGSLFLDVFIRTARQQGLPLVRLYAAAIVLGLAGLTKYNAALFGLGIAATILVTPSLRVLLRSPHLYLAGLITLLMQGPVLYWNWQHDFASFRFNLDERLSTPRSFGKGLGTLAVFLLVQIALVSPFAVARMVRFWSGTPTTPEKRLWQCTSLVIAALTFALFGALCFRGQVHYYWGLVGFILVFLAPSVSLGAGRWMRLHCLYGCLLAGAFTFNYAALPITALFGKSDEESALVYGWDEIGARIRQASDEHKTQFIIGSHYRIAAQLAFAMRRDDIESIASAHSGSQFAIWHDASARQGQNAIILTDEMVPLEAAVTSRFARVEPAGVIPVIRFGHELKRYRLFLGTGYRTP